MLYDDESSEVTVVQPNEAVADSGKRDEDMRERWSFHGFPCKRRMEYAENVMKTAGKSLECMNIIIDTLVSSEWMLG